MLTDAELAEIQGRVDAASPAPWHVARGWDGEPYAAVRANGGLDTSLASMLTPGVTPGGGYREPEERPLKNAEFIAHAREDVPALLAEVRSLRAQREAVLHTTNDRLTPKEGADLDMYEKGMRYGWEQAMKRVVRALGVAG